MTTGGSASRSGAACTRRATSGLARPRLRSMRRRFCGGGGWVGGGEEDEVGESECAVEQGGQSKRPWAQGQLGRPFTSREDEWALAALRRPASQPHLRRPLSFTCLHKVRGAQHAGQQA